jgi:hypothetical protein
MGRRIYVLGQNPKLKANGKHTPLIVEVQMSVPLKQTLFWKIPCKLLPHLIAARLNGGRAGNMYIGGNTPALPKHEKRLACYIGAASAPAGMEKGKITGLGIVEANCKAIRGEYADSNIKGMRDKKAIAPVVNTFARFSEQHNLVTMHLTSTYKRAAGGKMVNELSAGAGMPMRMSGFTCVRIRAVVRRLARVRAVKAHVPASPS